MTNDFPVRTWTVYWDYGGAPLIWDQEGQTVQTYVGVLLLHAGDMDTIVPDPMGKQFDDLGCVWESSDTAKIDWLTFHQEALRLTALLALWVAQFNIFVRYHAPYEDNRFAAHDCDTWMTPSNVARLAKGMPTLEDDPESWNFLLGLYDLESLEALGIIP